jgi:hypothetical protein
LAPFLVSTFVYKDLELPELVRRERNLFLLWAFPLYLRNLTAGRFVSLPAPKDLLPMGGFASKLSLGGLTEICQHISLNQGKNNNFHGDLHAFVPTLVI